MVMHSVRVRVESAKNLSRSGLGRVNLVRVGVEKSQERTATCAVRSRFLSRPLSRTAISRVIELSSYRVIEF